VISSLCDSTKVDAEHGRPVVRGNNRVTTLADQFSAPSEPRPTETTLAAAAVSPIGAVLSITDAAANACGYWRLPDFVQTRIPACRSWAPEAVGSYGANLAAFLNQGGEHVVEDCRPKRPAIRSGRKTGMIGAIRATKGS
jgi:transposase